MTITTAASAPLFAVVGARGIQGRSVIDAIIAGRIPYRVRGLMRDTSRAGDLVKLGVEAVAADADSTESMRKAFEGASTVFAMTTTYWDGWPLPDGEIKQGKNIIDAAKASSVKNLVWSSLTPLGRLTHGRPAAPSYDAKAIVAEYAHAIKGDMIVKSVLPGWYTSNWWNFILPEKQADGSYIWSLPAPPDAVMPFVDTEHDFGRFVMAALEAGSPDEILAGGYYRSYKDATADLAAFTGKDIRYVQVSDEEWLQKITASMGEAVAKEMLAICQACQAVGYYGGTKLEDSNSLLPMPPRTIIETLTANRATVEKLFR